MFYIFLGGGKNSRVTLLHDRHREENHVEAPLRSPGKTIIVVLRGNFYCLQNSDGMSTDFGFYGSITPLDTKNTVL